MRIATPEESISLMAKYSIPYAKSITAKSLPDLLNAANSLQKPLVLKLVSKEAVHKTEKGFVKLNIHDQLELKNNYEALLEAAGDIPVEEFILQEQAEGVEFIIGGKEDPSFGKVMIFGLGGIFVELLKERAIRVLPINSDEILDMINDTKAGAFLKGYRNKKVDSQKLVEIIYKTSELIQGEDILELDFNPVIADDKEIFVVDARIVLK